MKDRYFLKKEKVANLLFDMVKYLLTTLGAILLISDKAVKDELVVIVVLIAALILVAAVLITPLKED